MSETATREREPRQGELVDETGVVAVDPPTALQVLTSEEAFEGFYAKVKAECEKLDPDISTAAGRKAIASLAYKVAQTKTAIDKAGLALTEEWRTKTGQVNAARARIKRELDALRDEVRKPLSEWEAAEEARARRVKAKTDRLQAATIVTVDDTPATIGGRLDELRAMLIDEAEFQDVTETALAAKAAAVSVLEAAHARAVTAAAERAELDRLRRENEERQERERAAQAERERQEAEARAEQERKARDEREAAERAQAEERARAEAAEQARQEAETRAREEQEAREREHQAQLRREQEAREAAERRAAAEKVIAQLDGAAVVGIADTLDSLRRRLAEVKATEIAKEAFGDLSDQAERARARAEFAIQTEINRLEAAARERAESEARQRDQEHRNQIMGRARAALIATGGIGQDAAQKIVLAIAAGEIPNISIEF